MKNKVWLTRLTCWKTCKQEEGNLACKEFSTDSLHLENPEWILQTGSWQQYWSDIFTSRSKTYPIPPSTRWKGQGSKAELLLTKPVSWPIRVVQTFNLPTKLCPTIFVVPQNVWSNKMLGPTDCVSKKIRSNEICVQKYCMSKKNYVS